MFVHIWRVGDDHYTINQSTTRVTVLAAEDARRVVDIDGPALVLGTRPRIDLAIPMSQVQGFWVEEE